MTLEEMKDAAIAEAEIYAEPDCMPVITSEFHTTIVPRNQLAQIHAVSTAYSYGDVVQLATRNGHRYRCTVGGTSAATAPTFPTSDGASFIDGTVTWLEAGPDYANVYDVRAIIHQAWMAKATASSHLVSRSSGNSRTEYSLLQAQCRERARDFAPVGVA